MITKVAYITEDIKFTKEEEKELLEHCNWVLKRTFFSIPKEFYSGYINNKKLSSKHGPRLCPFHGKPYLFRIKKEYWFMGLKEEYYEYFALVPPCKCTDESVAKEWAKRVIEKYKKNQIKSINPKNQVFL